MSILKDVNKNADVSRLMCIYIFHFCMVMQHILKFMKGNTESSCILLTFWNVSGQVKGLKLFKRTVLQKKK
jgi:hypothetical protein